VPLHPAENRVIKLLLLAAQQTAHPTVPLLRPTPTPNQAVGELTRSPTWPACCTPSPIWTADPPPRANKASRPGEAPPLPCSSAPCVHSASRCPSTSQR